MPTGGAGASAAAAGGKRKVSEIRHDYYANKYEGGPAGGLAAGDAAGAAAAAAATGAKEAGAGNGEQKAAKLMKTPTGSAVANTERGFRFSIDRGGTFTDVYCEIPRYKDGRWDGVSFDSRVVKLLSVDPANYPDAPREAIRRVLEETTGIPHPKDKPVDSSRIEWIRMGTTVATNALLERKGERIAFVTTKGFRDLLRIGNQSRPRIFDLQIDRPDLLYDAVVEVEERVRIAVDEQTAAANASAPAAAARLTTSSREELGLSPVHPVPSTPRNTLGGSAGAAAGNANGKVAVREVVGVTGERVRILQPLNVADLRAQLATIRARGIQSLAVSLMHAYTFREHEALVGQIAQELGFTHISLSSAIMPMVKLVPRSFTACADAYLTPAIRRYVSQFVGGFDSHFVRDVRVLFMQSDGGLVDMREFSGFRAILSGPAAGVVGYSRTTPRDGGKAVIAFDMGGTSTDVSRFDGHFEHVFENTTAGVTIQAPQLDINTVAAGGGSMLFFRSGMFVVGPESASAHPGPTCYRKGGPLTVTDANLFLGRLRPEHFPKIFGKTQDKPLDVDATKAAFHKLTAEINQYFAEQHRHKLAKTKALESKGASAAGAAAAAAAAAAAPVDDVPAAKGKKGKGKGKGKGKKGKAAAAAAAAAEPAAMEDDGDTKADTKGVDAPAAAAAGAAPASGDGPIVMTPEQVAFGFIEVANESMCRPIRAMTQARGYSLKEHVLACFGGAGGQHACALARSLGIERIVVHRYSGILSAYGLHLADVVKEVQQPVAKVYSPAAVTELEQALAGLGVQASGALQAQGFLAADIRLKRFLNLRYEGTDTAMMTTLDNDDADCKDESAPAAGAAAATAATAGGDYASRFVSKYKREYGFTLDRKILVDDIRVRAIATARASASTTTSADGAVTPRPVPQVMPTPTQSLIKRVVAGADGKPAAATVVAAGKGAAADPHCRVEKVYFAGSWQDTRIFALSGLPPGYRVVGPAMLINNTSTILVTPHATAVIGDGGDVQITLAPKPTAHATAAGSVAAAAAAAKPDVPVFAAASNAPAALVSSGPAAAASSTPAASAAVDPIQLALFSHRFMSIAEQMGRTLQRTAISTNIKERLDFSCALFGPDGGLVANAPHLPVHLGAMQEAVRFQIQHLQRHGLSWKRGDVLVSNHPQAGGSHLPDITVITPVFADDAPAAAAVAAAAAGNGNGSSGNGLMLRTNSNAGAAGAAAAAGAPVFFVANRGHHSDIGGISPGSMPPFSKSLVHEGAAILSFKLVANGVFDERGISQLLLAVPDLTGADGGGGDDTDGGALKCSGTRNLRDNLSDLRAQVAANQKGITLVQELIGQYGLVMVQQYMAYIQQNAEMAVRDMLKEMVLTAGSAELRAEDFMDDGTPIRLRVTIDRDKGSAVFDFTGTGAQVYGNTNAPRAVTYSAIIYCLRCLVQRDIPLNQGCLNPVSIIIPEGCLLNPGPTAAVVGGNVLTSQRVTDVVLRAFQAAAASQGCMNNLTFGDKHFGYYETIAGGAGAGPGWHGQSGVHTHMTNTRITDPEILERRYPVLLRQFVLRSGSGGAGQFAGGEGVVRELEFLRPLSCGILSERRAFAPYGLKGGSDALRGFNSILTVDGRTLNIGRANTYHARTGDRIQINSPGGGGYGVPGAAAAAGKATAGAKGKAAKGKGKTVAAAASLPSHGSIAAYKETQEQA